MDNVIEVLRTMLEIRKKPNLFVSQCCKDPFEDRKIAEANALDVALLALEQKEDDRKQGAIEELKKVLELIDEDFENDSWVKTSNYCIERIKELEGAKEK